MNITPQQPNLPLATVFNPATDSLQRENHQREVIAQPAAASQSAAEKGVASDKERAKSTAPNNEQIDFVALQEQAEKAATTIGERSSGNGEQAKDKAKQDSIAGEQDDEQVKEAETRQKDAKQQVEQEQIRQLKARDLEVRAHEAAHAAVGGSATGAPSLSYEQGPDGVRYAVDGEVSVDLSPVRGDPAATIAKMQKVHAAALAPVRPSQQDKNVAAKASQLIADAQAELLQIKQPESSSDVQVRESFEQQDSLAPHVDSLASNDSDTDFDQFISNTLEKQDLLAPEIADEVKQRAARIQSFYLKITNAYEGANRHHFQLTA